MYSSAIKKNIDTGVPVLAPGRYANNSSLVQTEKVVGNLVLPCSTPTISYVYFLTVGTSLWIAPSTVQSPITYWIVGGGGGGGGAYDNSGGGGGAGGSVLTGTYEVIPNRTYAILVGAGGAGGTGLTLTSSTNGTAGESSTFDTEFGGPTAAGGAAGYHSRYVTGQFGNGGAIGLGGFGGGGGGCGGGGGGAASGGGGSTGSAGGIGGSGISYSFSGVQSGETVDYGVGGVGGRNLAGTNTYIVGEAGTANTGTGGGGGSASSSSPSGSRVVNGGGGGSGFVVIRYSA